MPRYKLTIEYDGSGFSGWQRQENGPSIQQVLEEAFFALTGHTISVHGAGRTDAGVHAREQVLHVDVPETAYAAQGDHNTLARRLSGVLPDDIGVRSVRRAAPGFDAWAVRPAHVERLHRADVHADAAVDAAAAVDRDSIAHGTLQ